MKRCLNPSVIAGLVVAGLAVYLFAPGAFAAALPLLVLAACPLSMLVMMAMMRPASAAPAAPSTDSAAELRAQVAQLQAEQATLVQRLEQHDVAGR